MPVPGAENDIAGVHAAADAIHDVAARAIVHVVGHALPIHGDEAMLRDEVVKAMAGRRAIVTGASKGCGAVIARTLAQAGMDLAIVGRNEADLQRTKTEIEAAGRACLIVKADLSTTEGVRRAGEEALSAAESWDVLVNNAGVVHAAALADVTIEQWDATFAVDLRAVLLLTQMVVRPMLARRSGKIINISSIGSYFGTPGLGAYAAAKAGLNQLTRTMAVEWGPHNVQANAICPTVIMTEMGRAFWDDPAHLADKNAKLERIPLHRFVETQDVADLVLFLASPSADFINGTCITLDGGMSVRP
jgi:NAD(P)-dependent dehydrogenase (short-subunit alcohol dehydrogenase family)